MRKKKIIKNILEDIKMLRVNCIMIYIIHKILMLLKITITLKHLLRTVCSCLSRTRFRVNPHSIVGLNVKELLARSRRET